MLDSRPIDETERKGIFMRLPVKTWVEFRFECFRHGLTMTAVVNELVAQWTAEQRRAAVPQYLRTDDDRTAT